MQRIAFIICIGMATVCAQPTPPTPPTPQAPDRDTEGKRLKESCTGFTFGGIASCAEALFTEHPLHIAVGSLAPQNGFGAGGAFVTHWTTANWRNSLDMDAVATPNGSWRAGAYFTAVWVRRHNIVPIKGIPDPSAPKPKEPTIQEQPVFHLYVENTSLNKLTYFGLGPNTRDTARSYFGMRESIAGGNVVWPAWKPLNMSLFAEANGRFVNIRGAHGQSSPSIEQLYTAATAPGLDNQPAYGQFGQGVQIRPSMVRDHIRLDYSVRLQEWVGSGGSAPSFRRFTVDLQHQYALYGTDTSSLPLPSNGPDDCSVSDDHACPPLVRPATQNKSRNLEGSIGFRLLIAESFLAAGQSVPFYFQPTLGGSDINGTPSLSSYQDYRFRGPNTILFRASFEHSLIKRFPLGVTAMIDEGKVAMTHGDVDFSHLRHSYSAGLTLRAGGLPLIYVLFSWGGREGMHTNARMDSSLLGGATRPSYY